jgi:serine/threonine protein kinase
MLQDNTSAPSGDIWSLGCIIYQMLVGNVPFKAPHDYQTFQLILERKMTFPSDMDPVGKDLVDKLLQVDVNERLGCKSSNTTLGFQAIKDHKFFEHINWELLPQAKPPIP